MPPLVKVVGLGGLGPPTSRLSGVRSNHLSYKPVAVFCLMTDSRNRCKDSWGSWKSALANFFFLFERRWSSRTFRYGYLVTTSPQLLILPWSPASLRSAQRLQVKPTSMVWRAVCTRPGNVFTATCWFAITSNSNFMFSSCREQSELRQLFGIRLRSHACFPLSLPL